MGRFLGPGGGSPGRVTVGVTVRDLGGGRGGGQGGGGGGGGGGKYQHEGPLSRWLTFHLHFFRSLSSQEGDEIGPGDALCDIETDKATMAFEAQVRRGGYKGEAATQCQRNDSWNSGSWASSLTLFEKGVAGGIDEAPCRGIGWEGEDAPQAP
jgi:hypothetical protein